MDGNEKVGLGCRPHMNVRTIPGSRCNVWIEVESNCATPSFPRVSFCPVLLICGSYFGDPPPPQDNVAITHTHIRVSRLTFQLFECALLSNRGLSHSVPFPPVSLQSVLMRLGVCLLPARCFHCFFPLSLLYFACFSLVAEAVPCRGGSCPADLCRVPIPFALTLFAVARSQSLQVRSSLPPVAAVPPCSLLGSASTWHCQHDVISFLNWVNVAGPRDPPHV